MPEDRNARQVLFVDGWSDEQVDEIERLGDEYFEPDDALELALLQHLHKRPEDFAPF